MLHAPDKAQGFRPLDLMTAAADSHAHTGKGALMADPPMLPPPAGFGLGTRVQAVPFQRSIKVFALRLNTPPVWPRL